MVSSRLVRDCLRPMDFNTSNRPPLVSVPHLRWRLVCHDICARILVVGCGGRWVYQMRLGWAFDVDLCEMGSVSVLFHWHDLLGMRRAWAMSLKYARRMSQDPARQFKMELCSASALCKPRHKQALRLLPGPIGQDHPAQPAER